MFVKFECGCIGFQIEKVNFVIKACETKDICIYRRGDLGEKDKEPLDLVEIEDLFDEIDQLVRDGYEYRNQFKVP